MNKIAAKLLTMFIKDREIRKKKRKQLIEGKNSAENMKLIMVLLCKDEIDIIENWFLFHKAMGVDGFIVTDNGSSDGTREVLQKYQEKGWVLDIIDEPSDGYKQVEWCNKMIMLAKNKYKADWIISSDSDEFWYATSLNLKEDILSNKGCNLQSVYLKDYIPYEDTDNFIKSGYFVQRKLNDFAQKIYNIKSKFYCMEDWTPKVILKAKDYKLVAGGNHDAKMKNKKLCHISNIIVYHYYIRNKNHFINKVKKGGEALLKNPDKSFGSHWRNWYENYYLTNSMDKAWNELFQFDIFDNLYEGGVIVKDKSVSEFMDKFVEELS